MRSKSSEDLVQWAGVSDVSWWECETPREGGLVTIYCAQQEVRYVF